MHTTNTEAAALRALDIRSLRLRRAALETQFAAAVCGDDPGLVRNLREALKESDRAEIALAFAR